ncbi:MAG: helix-turn-helix domain-containing protein [Cyclobacteriaceae bacterium]
MDFPFSFGQKSSLLLIFFVHGIVFSLLLLRKGFIHKNNSSSWLSLLLFLYAMYITPYMLGYANWYSGGWTRETLFFVPFMQVLLIGPVVYFYTKSLLNRSYKLSKRDYFHFVPAILYSVYSLVIFIVDKLVLEEFYFYADGRDKDLANWYQSVGLISMTYYLLVSLRYYFNYRKLIVEKVSYADTLLFKWIRNFMLAFLGILVLRVLFFIINPEWGNFGSQFWHYIAFSFVFYYIAVTGYSNSVKQAVLSEEKFEVVNVFEDFSTVPKTANPNIDIKQWKERLSHLMMEKALFKNPRLTLSDVANELGTTTKIISTVVNSGFDMNFNDFVNYFRIKAIEEKLNNGEQDTSTLLGIAFDCGFNSKSTFNRAFKKSTSLTPKEYVEKLS